MSFTQQVIEIVLFTPTRHAANITLTTRVTIDTPHAAFHYRIQTLNLVFICSFNVSSASLFIIKWSFRRTLTLSHTLHSTLHAAHCTLEATRPASLNTNVTDTFSNIFNNFSYFQRDASGNSTTYQWSLFLFLFQWEAECEVKWDKELALYTPLGVNIGRKRVL